MKILYHHRLGSKDGQIVHVEEIVAALRGLGHEVILVAPPATERASFGADSGAVAQLKRLVPPSLYELMELGYSFLAFWRLWRSYRRHRPDVLYERYNLYCLAGVWLKRFTRMPMLLEVNAPLVHERSQFGRLANRRLAAWVERTTWRAADHVLPVTRVLAEFVRNAGVAAERITVIQNGVSPAFLEERERGSAVRKRLGLEGRLVLGFTGFVRDWHGLEQVIELVAESGARYDLNFLLVGDGPALVLLRQLATRLGVTDRVTFAGLVPREAIPDYVGAFDIAMQPRVVPYASPLKLFEYMALGRAIIAPATPNIAEVLRDGETALLFDPAQPATFRAAVERMCRDASLRDRVGNAARAAVARQGLTWANNARRITALFQELLTASARSPGDEHRGSSPGGHRA